MNLAEQRSHFFVTLKHTIVQPQLRISAMANTELCPQTKFDGTGKGGQREVTEMAAGVAVCNNQRFGTALYLLATAFSWPRWHHDCIRMQRRMSWSIYLLEPND